MKAGANQYSSPPQKFAEGSKGEARDKAAEALHTNRQYVSDAKQLETETPDLFAQVLAGEINK